MEDLHEKPHSLLEEPDGEGPFHWPPAVWIGLAVCVLATGVAIGFHSTKDPSHYHQKVMDNLWTTYSIGDPKHTVLGNLRTSLVNSQVICGRINYQKVQPYGKGWSGFTDFFMEDGVVYVASMNGRYSGRFGELCLTSGVDRP